MLRTVLIGVSRARALVGLFCFLVGSFITLPPLLALNVQSDEEAQHNLQEDESASIASSNASIIVANSSTESWFYEDGPNLTPD
jgi:hypothetical protein